jgi:hypothetical protein
MASAARVAKVTPPTPPRLEVAFVLDTTGSMGGLIEGAKRTIWGIARQIGEGRPRPDLRIALVAYRDLGDAYVTRVFNFTGDMDTVYENLMSFQAGGGGDGPEHVSRALSDAVHAVSWTGGQAVKVIFLVGDAPPHVDYQDGFDYRRHVLEARQRGIAVETIQCGGDPQTDRVWREIAAQGDGHYARIDAQGGMPAMVTPVDGELAKLNAELTATVVATGSLAERSVTERKLEARKAMAAPMAAEAAGYYGSSDRLAEKDAVDLPIAAQRQVLADMRKDDSQAPSALKGKNEAEALAYLKTQKQRRDQIQARIQTLQKQREEALRQARGAADAGFDAQVVQSLKAQAAKQGIAY